MLSYVIKSSWHFIATRWIDLSRVLAIPFAAVVSIDVLLGLIGIQGSPAELITSATYTWLAVPTHRLILLDDMNLPRWGQREWKFLGYLVSAGFAVSFIVAIAIGIPSILLLPDSAPPSFVVLVLVLIAMALMSRICIIFPAIAVDHSLRLGEADKLLSGFRASSLVVCVVIPFLASVPIVLAALISSGRLSSVLISVAAALAVVVGVVALSFLYQGVIRSAA